MTEKEVEIEFTKQISEYMKVGKIFEAINKKYGENIRITITEAKIAPSFKKGEMQIKIFAKTQIVTANNDN